MYTDNDTIAAISTSLTPSGIGIIRLSGEKSIDIVHELFIAKNGRKNLTNSKSHFLNYGTFIDNDNNRIDEVLVSVMRTPNTYTKEDVVEINTHGGVLVMKKILRLLLQNGARLAEPGEFTKRAFLNGRIDLSQAEAVIDIINAQTDLSLESSVNHLNGALKKEVDNIIEVILALIAHVEASIDYPEYDIEELNSDNVLDEISKVKAMTQKLINSYDNGRIIYNGIKTVIVGKPNVGKSSLLNNLLREQRAIVSDIPGTTRDTLEEFMNLNGVPLKLIDTAGIRETDDVVEKIGVERTKESIEAADLVIFVIDSSADLSEDDHTIHEMIDNKKSIILLNKIDLGQKISESHIKELFNHSSIISISVKDDQGIELIVDEITKLYQLDEISFNDRVYITNVRHKTALEKCLLAINEVINGIQLDMPIDLLAIDLKNVYDYLSELTGDNVNDDIIQTIFSQFCLGK